MTPNKAILSTAYFPPIQFFSKLSKYDEVKIELFESFPKQTYRNRCCLYSANGLQNLTVPVAKAKSKQLTKDVKIYNEEDWQRYSLKCLESAYRRSPFYEYYIDYLLPFFENEYEFLIDLNNEIIEKFIEILEIDTRISFTTNYENVLPDDYKDFRNIISPKNNVKETDKEFCQQEYIQVFSEKYGFIENLSILDLLFCEGPNSLTIINNCVCK